MAADLGHPKACCFSLDSQVFDGLHGWG
jgi:hypothetical protein